SIAGVGLRAPAATPGLPDVGTIMKDVEFDFDSLGKLTADIEVATTYPIREFHFQLGPQDYLHFGCKFTPPDRQRERFLQRVVQALERTPRLCDCSGPASARFAIEWRPLPGLRLSR